MNQVVFVGRIVRDIEVRTVGSNGRVVNNVIAINRFQKDAKGESLTDFIPFVAWNNYADLMERYCAKGQQIAIAGRMQSRKYTNKDNQDVYVIECLVSDITLIQSRNTEAGQSQPVGGSSEQMSQREVENMKEVLGHSAN